MSAASEQDRLSPDHPLYYAPRRSSERSGSRSSPSLDATTERAGRPGSPAFPVDGEPKNPLSEARPVDPAVVRGRPEPFDAQSEKTVSRSALHRLEPEIIHEHPALAQQRMAMLGVARRFALPVGIAAIVALFFVI